MRSTRTKYSKKKERLKSFNFDILLHGYHVYTSSFNHAVMNRAITPVVQSHEAQTHHLTLTRAKIHGAVEFCEAMNISYFKNDVFRVCNVFK